MQCNSRAGFQRKAVSAQKKTSGCVALLLCSKLLASCTRREAAKAEAKKPGPVQTDGEHANTKEEEVGPDFKQPQSGTKGVIIKYYTIRILCDFRNKCP